MTRARWNRSDPASGQDTAFSLFFRAGLSDGVAGYRMHLLSAPAAWIGRSVRLNFGAVAHDSAVFVNGRYAGEHHCGHTAFSIEIGCPAPLRAGQCHHCPGGFAGKPQHPALRLRDRLSDLRGHLPRGDAGGEGACPHR